MRKIIFLTLVMILGMSSVSLGKSYLCLKDVSSMFVFLDGKYEIVSVKPFKYIIKTEDNDNRIVYVKYFGSENYICKDGEFDRENIGDKNISVKSVRGVKFLTCRVPYKKEYGGHTYKEFNLNLNLMRFNYYTNYDHSHTSSHENTNGSVYEKGKCEEI